MKDEFLLVDGYNMIFAWDKLKNIAEENLEDARDKLLDIMSNYQGYKNIEVIVVFDGYKIKGSVRKIHNYNNIEVVFTKERETADNYIEKVAHIIGRSYKVRVATSDALEQTIIFSKGATRISARELNLEVKMMKEEIKQEYISKQVMTTNSLISNLDPAVERLMQKMRRQK